MNAGLAYELAYSYESFIQELIWAVSYRGDRGHVVSDSAYLWLCNEQNRAMSETSAMCARLY